MNLSSLMGYNTNHLQVIVNTGNFSVISFIFVSRVLFCKRRYHVLGIPTLLLPEHGSCMGTP